jgi:hypothetical protein
MAEYEGRLNGETTPLPIAGPEMPVGPADSVRTNSDDGAIRRACGVGDVADDQGLVQFFNNGCAHEALLLFVD